MTTTLRNEHILRTYAPAVFAEAPDTSRVSNRYSFLPTTEVLSILQDEGWEVWKASQVKSRTWSKDHAKHIVRLRHVDMRESDFGVGDSFPEMLVINSHNGLGRYELRGGIFRLVCENGMVISESDFGAVEVRHIGFESQQVIKASQDLIRTSTKIADKIGTWQNITLSSPQREKFVTDAANLRFDSPNEVLIDSVGLPRRLADQKNDLWTVYNVCQENLLRGGYINQNTKRVVRPITNIQRNVNLNSSLWELASSFTPN